MFQQYFSFNYYWKKLIKKLMLYYIINEEISFKKKLLS